MIICMLEGIGYVIVYFGGMGKRCDFYWVRGCGNL